MNSRVKKIILILLAGVLLVGSSQMQKSLNRDRDRLGMTYAATLHNAPPLLAFTTVALGGFRGLISNFLWIRSNDLQLDDKFFEAAQLANWITDLEPHFDQVWAYQAWNMAWNISIKFEDNAPGIYSDRWRWVENGIELLRDQGLRYNPDSVLLHHDLAWLFQFKMGGNLDDAEVYYKQQWAREMTPFFGPDGTNFAVLINPQTAAQKTNALVLREKYKLDPVFAQQLDVQYGPLDWRLPEAHAIYWYALGLVKAKQNPDKVNPDELITLRRGIYQSIFQAFKHGRIMANPLNNSYVLGPNLDLVPQVDKAYMENYAEETQPGQQQGILKAHRNFLMDAVYFLYVNNRKTEAAKWFRILGDKYPNQGIIEGDPASLPRNLTLLDFAAAHIQSEIGDTSQERTTSVIEGLLRTAYTVLAAGQDDDYATYKLLAARIYENYIQKVSKMKANLERVQLPPYDFLNRTALNDLLDPQHGLPFAARAVIRSQVGMPPETNALPAMATNPPPVPATNEVENVPTNSAAK